MGEITFVNYAATTFLKKAFAHNGTVIGASVTNNMFSIDRMWRWGSTSAITSLVFGLTGGGNFITGSRFTLYGIN